MNSAATCKGEIDPAKQNVQCWKPAADQSADEVASAWSSTCELRYGMTGRIAIARGRVEKWKVMR